MADNHTLERFTDAQHRVYEQALRKIKNGRKTSHWMWFIFPQFTGLGYSETARYYAIQNRQEAGAYLQHPVLGSRLREISAALLPLQTNDPAAVFGSTDSLKLKSSMTLFSVLENTDPVFQKVLDKFFRGTKDEKTLQLLKAGE